MSNPPSMTASESAAAHEAMRYRLSVLSHLEKDDRDREGTGILMALTLMNIHPEQATPEQLRFADTLRTDMLTTMATAETFAVTAELCALLNQSSPAYPTTSMSPADILTPCGLAFFHHQVQDPDPETASPTLLLRAISWKLSDTDEITTEAFKTNAWDSTVTIIGYTDTHLMPGYAARHQNRYPAMWPVFSVVWRVGVENGGWPWEETHRRIKTSRGPYVKTLMALWTILRQRLTESETVPATPRKLVHRDDRKRLDWARRTKDLNTAVHIVRLRPRRPVASAAGQKVEWRNSWVVRSHWRRLTDPRTGEVRPKLILSYIKGPRDKPLIGKERVYLPPKPQQPKE